MNNFVVVTSVTAADGKITFHRQTITVEAGEFTAAKATPIHYYIDQSREPLFSINPGGGWVSPTFEKLEMLREAGEEPEDIDVVRCKCHKTSLPSDIPFLEKSGHCESCVRRARIPVSEVVSALVSVHGGGGLPAATQAVLDSAPRAKTEIPEGGLDENSLGNLFSALSGSGVGGQDQMSLDEGLKAAFITKSCDSRTVISQLWSDFNFTKCGGCGSWGRMGSNRRCRECSKTA